MDAISAATVWMEASRMKRVLVRPVADGCFGPAAAGAGVGSGGGGGIAQR